MIARHLTRCSVAIAAAIALASTGGCSKDGNTPGAKAETSAPSNDTLAEAVAKEGDLSKLSEALKDTGLSSVFDSSGSYTIFAPTDEAFGQLGDAGKTLAGEDQRAVLAAVLRDHIVPGYLTPDDIGSAIDAQGGQVKITTMGDHTLAFTRQDNGYLVTAEDGSTAKIAGDPVTASDGVAIPVDRVLKKVTPSG